VRATLSEKTIHCPFCAERLSILLDLSAGGQSYVEDCQVCCRPMQISYEVENDRAVDIRVDCAA